MGVLPTQVGIRSERDSRFVAPLDDTNTPSPHHPWDIDTEKPSVARVYDAFLGGGRSFESDRAFARRVEAIIPDAHQLAVANRRFLARAVRLCVTAGVTQVIDLGAGVVADIGLHHTVHTVNPDARVMYVDNEAVAVQSLLPVVAADRRLGVVRADARDPEAVLGHPVTTSLLDLAQPVVLVMGLLLHFIPDSDDPADLLARYRDQIASGSYLVISHDTADGREQDMRQVARLYAETNRPLTLRDRAGLLALLDGYSLVPPGIVHLPLWRPDEDEPDLGPPERSCMYAAVART